MLLPRLLTYGILGLVAVLVLVDTNIGTPLNDDDHTMVQRAISHLQGNGFHRDSEFASGILRSGSFRCSHFYTNLAHLGDVQGDGFSFYAYTPVLSRSHVFVGKGFKRAGDAGRASILVHELTHLRNHEAHALIGFHRSMDEALAYRRQYETYRQVGLSPDGEDGVVYWDMMIGVVTYVLARFPEYGGRQDIREAKALLAQTPAEPSPDYLRLTMFGVGALVMLAIGDRLGLRVACLVLKRCPVTPLLHLDAWLLPLLILMPAFVLAAAVAVLVFAGSPEKLSFLARHLITIILALFGLSGLIGGFLGHGADTHRPPSATRRPM